MERSSKPLRKQIVNAVSGHRYMQTEAMVILTTPMIDAMPTQITTVAALSMATSVHTGHFDGLERFRPFGRAQRPAVVPIMARLGKHHGLGPSPTVPSVEALAGAGRARSGPRGGHRGGEADAMHPEGQVRTKLRSVGVTTSPCPSAARCHRSSPAAATARSRSSGTANGRQSSRTRPCSRLRPFCTMCWWNRSLGVKPETEAQGGALRRLVKVVAFPFEMPVAKRVEGVAGEQE